MPKKDHRVQTNSPSKYLLDLENLLEDIEHQRLVEECGIDFGEDGDAVEGLIDWDDKLNRGNF